MATAKHSFYRPHKRVTFDNARINLATGEVITEESRTKQSFIEECDLNNILRQFKPHELKEIMSRNVALGAFQDLPDQIDFQGALNLVQEGSKAFALLDSGTRARFENNPANFLEFMADPKNQDEAIKLGLATDKRPTPPAPPPGQTQASGSTSNGNSNKPTPPDSKSSSTSQPT